MVRSIINRTTTTPNTRQVPPFVPLSRVLDQFLSDDPFFALAPIALNQNTSTGMALDFGEDETSYLVRASLPGFEEKDITCEVNDGVLTIKAEKTEEEDTGNQTWHRRERRFGAVMRQIQLPAPVMEDQAQAELANGVLTLRLPKVQKAPARRIAINGTKGDGAQTSPRQDGQTSHGHNTNRMAGANR